MWQQSPALLTEGNEPSAEQCLILKRMLTILEDDVLNECNDENLGWCVLKG